MKSDFAEILYDENTLEKKVTELANEISNDFRGKEPVIVCVLNSSIFFFSDLFQKLDYPAYPDYIECHPDCHSNHGDKFKILRDLRTDIKGRYVVIVNSINETGSSLNFIRETLLMREPASLKICCLFNKNVEKAHQVPIDYLGFNVENKSLAGYGLEYQNKFANIPVVGTIKPSVKY